jgi:hypothetical protein
VESVRSLLGYLSPYVRSLELRIEELNTERVALQNRLLHAYSGYELKQNVPSYYEAQQKDAGTANVGDAVMGTGSHSTVDVLKKLEDASWEEDSGITGMTAEAARQRAQEEFDNNAKEYEQRVLQARRDAAAKSGISEVV